MRLANAAVSGLLVVLCLSPAQPVRADTQLGIQALAITGTHFQPRGDVSGTGLGALFSLDQRWRSVQIHMEGFPSVGTASVNTPTGPVRASIGLFAATGRMRLDRLGRLWVGLGTEVLAQQTPQVAVYKVDASRLAGTRYEVFSSFPTAPDRFVETQVAVMPHLSGMVYETRSTPFTTPYVVSGAETASMLDLSVAYGVRHGNRDYLIGVRAINFAAKFVDGREADRNVGEGVSAELRFHL